MSLRSIALALGGDLYDGGFRASVPAPGHSAADRSVSLRLAGDRVLIHSFGGADWREVRAQLRDLGLIDQAGAPTRGGTARAGRPDACSGGRADRLSRIRIARQLWDEAAPLSPGTASANHLRARLGSSAPADSPVLRHHHAAPVAVLRPAGRRLPALLARISDASDRLTAVEIAYLRPDGRRADWVRVPRKTVGAVPAGSAVRLCAPAPRMLVGEGVMTVLSAANRFGLPGWALLSARNLAAWSPPGNVRRVLVAADPGAAGEGAAARLAGRLRAMGVEAEIALPPAGFGDWNEAAAEAGRREEGR